MKTMLKITALLLVLLLACPCAFAAFDKYGNYYVAEGEEPDYGLLGGAPATSTETYSGTYYNGGYTAYASAYTPVVGNSTNLSSNIYLAAMALDGTYIHPGVKFSFNGTVGPRTYERGYGDAMNGRGAEVLGGGVSQVATTLMLALRNFGYMAFDEYYTYGKDFVGGYVSDPNDAVITDYSSGYDLAFTSSYPYSIQIRFTLQNNTLTCELYGLDQNYNSQQNTNPQQNSGIAAEGKTFLSYDQNLLHNIRLACDAINGVTLTYGQKFSFNSIVGPRSYAAGYCDALNGRGVTVTGGGVAQVASTVYLAAKQMSSIVIDAVRTYGENYKGNYVTNSADAIVTDYSANVDFSFTYYGAGTLYITFVEDGDNLLCDFYEF